MKDNCGRGPLLYAAWHGRVAFLGAIITANDADPDRKDHYGLTPLSVSVRHGHTETVSLLLATENVTCDSRDCFGRSVFWWAQRMGSPAIQELLTDYSKKQGTPICDGPVDRWSIPKQHPSRVCDCCTLDMTEGAVYYQCNTCYEGNFDLCMACY